MISLHHGQVAPEIRPESAFPSTRPATVPNFRLCEKSGRYVARRPLSDEQIIRAAKAILKQRLFRNRRALTSAAKAADFLILCLAPYEREVFGCLFLDRQHRPLAFEEVFRGGIASADVHPREVVKLALHYNAEAVILAHNHPSGGLAPSPHDRRITLLVKAALALVDVRVLDHFIVGGGRSYSFAEYGLLNGTASQPAQDQGGPDHG